MIFCTHYNDIDWDSIADNTKLAIPILSDHQKHRCENRISFIYLYDFDTETEYVIGCNHNDLEKNDAAWISQVNWGSVLFSYKNAVLKDYGVDSWDIDICYWLQYNTPLEIGLSDDITTYHKWYRMIHNVNDIVPIVSYIEYCQNIVDNFKECLLDIQFDKTLNFYNNIVLDNFRQIENSGIEVDSEIVKKFFNKPADILYSQYFPYTSTGRPSNRFGGINFAALEKTNGVREMIKVKGPDKFLIEYDYDSHHVRLVAKLIGYQLPDGNLHDYFGRQYFNTPVLTEEQYNESKGITFKMLYGNITPEYADIKFFKLVHQYRKELWAEFKLNGFIDAPLTKRKIYYKNFEDMAPNKLFNYVLQGYETDVNNLMLSKILKYLYQKKSKLILYTYDSFLFEYNTIDGKEFINDIGNILNDYGMKASWKVGKNYNQMKKINTKLK